MRAMRRLGRESVRKDAAVSAIAVLAAQCLEGIERASASLLMIDDRPRIGLAQSYRGGRKLVLTSKEFALLELFMRRPSEVLSRAVLLEHAWDFAYDGDSNVVDVYIRYLRDKIDRPFGKESIETVWGVGYRLNP